MNSPEHPAYDVIIVGGGPAGLSAALVLARCRRTVLVIDEGRPRNAKAQVMHGFLSRDGENPAEFLRIAREQVQAYEGVDFLDDEVVSVERGHERFTVHTQKSGAQTSRVLLLATGIVDEVPPLQGVQDFYGSTVQLCPYCHGWEHRDQKIIVYGKGKEGAEFALEMLGWSRKLVLCTDGGDGIPQELRETLGRFEVPIEDEKIIALEGEGDQIRGARFESGRFLECEALFFYSRQRQCSKLAEQLGLALDEDGAQIEHCDTTSSIPGLYVAGNTCTGLQLVIMAAADGTQAAFKINQALLELDLERADEALERSEPVPEPNTIMTPEAP